MSDLLSQASLVLIPSGYKEDVVYSVVPSDGSGDLSFTRASNGTRVNSAGLVEVCPWNLLENTNTFSGWNLEGGALTSGFTAPDGSSTAYKYVQTTGGLYSGFIGTNPNVQFAQVWIKSVSGGSITCNISDGSAFFGTLNVTGTWQLFTAPYTANSRMSLYLYAISNAQGIYVWHPQLNIGSTAKPYFPTTDRLNVPRLTYQNGGGGCPSLLLEKQSTNSILYSEQFDNAGWTTGFSALTPNAVTANYGISPDGTQNADRIQLTVNASNVASQIYQFPSSSATTYTASVWLKSLSGTPTISIVDSYNITGGYQLVTLTTEWVRYTKTFAAGAGGILPQFLLYHGTTSSSADFLAWGFQVEQSSYPTSYIPTTSASATRVADACFKTGISSLIGQTTGSVFVDFELYTLDGFEGVIEIIKTTGGADRWLIWRNNANLQLYSSFGASNLGATIGIGRHKACFVYTPTSLKYFVDGVKVGDATTMGTFTGGFDKLDFENSAGSVYFQKKNIYESVVSKTEFTEAEAISLTTI